MIGIWPFPAERVTELGARVGRIIVPEMNLGQLVHKVREYVPDSCRVVGLPSIGGRLHHPSDIIRVVLGENS